MKEKTIFEIVKDVDSTKVIHGIAKLFEEGIRVENELGLINSSALEEAVGDTFINWELKGLCSDLDMYKEVIGIMDIRKQEHLNERTVTNYLEYVINAVSF
ncbi:MAG: hypothetical protein MJY64_03120 [archaeon]|nr:hypothetical protein [archaeon]